MKLELAERQFQTAAIDPAITGWFGNAAKMRIVRRLLASPDPLSIIDYGAGSGQGWHSILAARPDFALTCYEPAGCAVRGALNIKGDADALDLTADVVVSFSVFEHVYDRAAYLANAWRWLRPGGTLFLNYDDGHFRTPGSWTEALRNRLAPILPALGMVKHYQSSVDAEGLDALIAQTGFSVVGQCYENLPAFKALAKTMPPHNRAAFAELWLETEARLNTLGADLWAQMPSRTLELVKPSPSA